MKKIILALIGIMIFLVGCTSETPIGAVDKPFVGGTDSINFNFMEETPPTEVYDNGQQPFEVTLNLENVGEYDVAKEDIKITLSGFYPGDFSNPVTEKHPDENLRGAYIDSDGEVQKGTITYVNFPGFNFAGSATGIDRYIIRADVCYKYGTRAQANLCILDDLTPTEDQVCSITGPKTSAVSGAPVQIENLKEEVAGTRKIRFSFDVVHRGNGLVSYLGSDCDSGLDKKDRVWVEVDTGIGSVSCTGLTGGSSTTGYATLYNGKSKILCTQDLSGVQGNFEKKASVLLKYDYKQHKERQVLVKHVTIG